MRNKVGRDIEPSVVLAVFEETFNTAPFGFACDWETMVINKISQQYDRPARAKGLSEGMQVVSVNGKPATREGVKEASRAAKQDGVPANIKFSCTGKRINLVDERYSIVEQDNAVKFLYFLCAWFLVVYPTFKVKVGLSIWRGPLFQHPYSSLDSGLA